MLLESVSSTTPFFIVTLFYIVIGLISIPCIIVLIKLIQALDTYIKKNSN